jgi:glucose-1-phosphate thymidylyltransferase
MHAFVLAGGFATRLWPLTEHRAKPLLPLAGKPMIEHIVDKIPDTIPVTVSTNAAFGPAFRHWALRTGRARLDVIVEKTKSDDEKIGALGAVAQWVEAAGINDDVIMLAGDNYLGYSFTDFLAAYRPGTPLLAAYDIKDLEQAKKFGIVILAEDGKSIAAFEEKPKEPKSTLASTGCSIIPKALLPVLLDFAKRKPDNLGGIFEEFLSKGTPVDCFTFTEPWFDVGSYEAYLEATRRLVDKRVELGEGAMCENCVCEGAVVIGAGSVVRDSRLKDTVVFERSVIEDCVLEDCIIDDDCRLLRADLRGKMIRKGTVLEQLQPF